MSAQVQVSELQLRIAATASLEAMTMMAKKAGVTHEAVMDAVVNDPEGATARYFRQLVEGAMRDVPAMLQGAQA